MSSNVHAKIKGYASYDPANLKNISKTEEQYRLLLKLYNHNKLQAKSLYAKAPGWAYVKVAAEQKPGYFANFLHEVKAVLASLKRGTLSTANNS